jgi:single-stranded DNA-binding protein
VNPIRIHGNMTKDVKVGEKNGKAYAHFTVASDNGKYKDTGTSFLNCVAFGTWVHELSDLAKGAFVKLIGSVRTSEYDGRVSWQVVVRHVKRATKEASA